MAGDDLVVSGIELDARDTLREINRLDRQLRRLEDQVDDVTRATDKAERSVGGMGKALVGAAAAFGAFQAAERAAGFIFRVNKEFQQLEARLVSVTGSTDDAADAFRMIKDFAQETPFQIQGLLEAFTQLQLRGIEPTRDMMRDLGNFAAAFGKDLTQLTSAILRAAQGGTERLREGFGIPIEKQGENIVLTFKGTRKVVEAEAGAMVQAFRELAEENFGNAMGRQMDTLVGSISNLEDTASVAANKVGEQGLNDAIQDLAGTIDKAIADNDEFAKSLGETLAKGVGTADEALQLFLEHTEALVQAMEVLVSISVARAVTSMATSFATAAASAGTLRAALAALGGPAGLIATYIGTLAALTDEYDETTDATDNLREATDNLTESLGEMSAQQVRSVMAAVKADLIATEGRIDQLQQKIEETAGQEGTAGGRLGLGVQQGKELARLQSEQANLEMQATTLADTLAQLHDRLMEVGDAGSEAGEGSEDAAESTAEHAEEIEELLGELRQERDELRFSERELLKRELAELGASDATTQQALAIQEKIEALEAEQEAQEKAAEAEEERIEQAKRAMEQGREEVRQIHEKARQRAQESTSELNLKRIEEEVRRVERAGDAIGEAFADAAVDVVTQTESIIDAVEQMVDEILRQVARLVFSQTIGKAIANFATGALGGTIPDAPAPIPEPDAPDFSGMDLPGFASGGSFEVGGSGGTDSQLVGFMATPGEEVKVETPDQQRRGGRGGPTQQTVVNQKNTIHMSTPSPREMRDVLRRHKGDLWAIFREGRQKGMI